VSGRQKTRLTNINVLIITVDNMGFFHNFAITKNIDHNIFPIADLALKMARDRNEHVHNPIMTNPGKSLH